nr:hypothetical protein [Bradyrhizobium sp.]
MKGAKSYRSLQLPLFVHFHWTNARLFKLAGNRRRRASQGLSLIRPNNFVSEQQTHEIIGSDIPDPTRTIVFSDQRSLSFEQILATEPAIDLGGSGDWTRVELRLIVADYFAVLNDEASGRTYSKTDHRNG